MKFTAGFIAGLAIAVAAVVVAQAPVLNAVHITCNNDGSMNIKPGL